MQMCWLFAPTPTRIHVTHGACSHLQHTRERRSASLPHLFLSVIDWTCQYSVGKKQRLHLLIQTPLFLSLSLSADLNYTSFYQASRGSTPAAALFIKCSVQIHTSKLMRDNRAVNQTSGASELINLDSDHKSLKKLFQEPGKIIIFPLQINNVEFYGGSNLGVTN